MQRWLELSPRYGLEVVGPRCRPMREVAQDRQHTPVVMLRGRRPSLPKMLATCFSTAQVDRTSTSPIPALDRPCAIRDSTSRSREVSAATPARLAASIWLTTSGVERGAAGRDAGQRVGEFSHAGDPVPEQVAHAGGAACEQLGGGPGLYVLGEHQHASARVQVPQFQRGAQSLVGARGRHPDVHHSDVRTMLGHRREQRCAVRHRRADLVPAIGEQPGQALAHHARVFGDNDSHGVITPAAEGRRGPGSGRPAGC